jgi:ABC-type multidrug transport system fused ATPase/permease subunit
MYFSHSPAGSLAIISVFVVAGARLMPVMTGAFTNVGQIKGQAKVAQLLYEELQFVEKAALPTTDTEKHELKHEAFVELEFAAVDFQYPQTDRLAIDQVNLLLKKGESIGVIGTTGAGKTTLINLLIGLLQPTAGEIKVNGLPQITRREYWLGKVAYIPQDAFVLEDSIKQNIVFGQAESEIDEQRVQESIKLAALEKTIANLSHGLDTLVGEDGVKLSGGQRQRLALARAFYHQREVIIMDEATSALDNATEKEIIEAMKRLHGVKTLVVIAHRLSTIEFCDRVYRLEDGRVVDQGSYHSVVGDH